MPDSLELPGMRRAVVPLVRPGHAVVHELVAHRLPGLAGIVGALDHLSEPACRLGRIEPVRVGGRPLEVIHLPAPEVRTGNVPLFALSVRRQNECALPRTYQNSYPAHLGLLSRLTAVDHPRRAESIYKHTEAGGPERLLQRHPHCTVPRQSLKQAFRVIRM